MKTLSRLFIFTFLNICATSFSQGTNFQFALVTDTHIGSSTSASDLRLTVKDINENDSLASMPATSWHPL